ncbi:MAG: nitroreductase family protein [Bacteroidales bacterium]|nr:nitroreductase family protein [Bacteroidales bacterium]
MNPIEIKKPQTTYHLNDLLYKRWSPRAFSDAPVETEKLQRIFEAARWAPSASNIQPWYFLVGFKGDAVYSGIFETLVEFNQLWVKTAPVLCLAICRVNNPKGTENKTRAYDLGQSVAHLSIQATEEGLYVHQMAGFDADKAAELLNISSDFEVRVAFTIGYTGDAEALHPNLRKMEFEARTRRQLDETVFTGQFGEKASFLL